MTYTTAVTTYSEYIQQGQSFQNKKEFNQAIQSYENAKELEPNNFEPYYLLGEIAHIQKKKSDAIELYQKAIELNPKHFESLAKLGEIYLFDEKLKDSIKYYQLAYELKPNSALVCYRLAENFKKSARYDEAIEYYQKALEINPDSAKTYYQLAIILDKLGKHSQAREYRDRAIKIKPDSTFAWVKLGDVLTTQNKLDEAIKCYQTACYQRNIELKPELKQYDWESSNKHTPDFMIIGVAKCGTTSLFNYLSKHPKVLIPNTKEIDFFSRGFDKGIEWYLSQFPSLADHPKFITGEASVSYFYAEDADKRIFNSIKNTKFIVLLRNPAERAISWYYYRLKKLQETKPIEVAIGSDLNRLKNLKAEDLLYNSGYLCPGLYVYKLKRWMNLFDRDRFLILDSEQFYQNTANVMDRVYDFLNLESHEHPKYRKYNAGSYDTTNDELRNRLSEFFEPHNRKLEEFLGMKFNWS